MPEFEGGSEFVRRQARPVPDPVFVGLAVACPLD